MTEVEWFASVETIPMMNYLAGRVSDRKMRLLAVGCCRRISHQVFDQRSRVAIEMTERFIEGEISAAELKVASQECETLNSERGRSWGDGAGEAAAWVTSLAPEWNPERWPCIDSVISCARNAAVYAAEKSGTDKKARKAASTRAFDEEQLGQVRLIRCIVGNPFHRPAFDPRWRTADVVGLAGGIYEDRAFDRLPILADALMDAGCEDEDIIGHCRTQESHVRGCWVVDMALGRE